MERQPKWLIAISLVGLIAGAGCINIGNLGGGTISGIDATGATGIDATGAAAGATVDVNTSATSAGSITVIEQPKSPGAPSIPSEHPSNPTSPEPPITPPPVTPGTSAKANVHGIVFDDLGQRLSGVTVTARILGTGTFANGSDTRTVTTQAGTYALPDTPTGETVLITVKKAGYTTRQRTIVPLADQQGNLDRNRVDFGGTNLEAFAMSDKPEVISMTPAPDATGVDSSTSFTLTFSEPVNKQDVEQGFAIFVAGGPGSSYPLSAGASLPVSYNFASHTVTGAPIYDQSAFYFAWSNNGQTLTATCRLGTKLPTDKDSSKLPQYAISFKGPVRDASGSGVQTDQFFRPSLTKLGQNGYRFTVAADTTAPRLSNVTAISGNPGQIRAQFSETMVLRLNNGLTIPAQALHQATNPSNYRYEAGLSTMPAPGSLSLMPQSAVFYDIDSTNSTVRMGTASSLNAGEHVWLEVNPAIMDPAGNRVETSNGANIRSAHAF